MKKMLRYCLAVRRISDKNNNSHWKYWYHRGDGPAGRLNDWPTLCITMMVIITLSLYVPIFTYSALPFFHFSPLITRCWYMFLSNHSIIGGTEQFLYSTVYRMWGVIGRVFAHVCVCVISKTFGFFVVLQFMSIYTHSWFTGCIT